MTGSIVGRKSVALLTSWEELCGIAHYSWFLKRALDKYLDIKIIRTPRDVLPNAYSPADIQFANRLVDQIVKEVAHFDVVCMQFEPNIFSFDPVRALGRVQRILQNSKDFVIAFHYVPRQPRVRLRSFRYRRLRQYFKAKKVERAWDRFFEALIRHSRSHRVVAVSHNRVDARYLQMRAVLGEKDNE